MANYKAEFMRHMDQKGIKYTDVGDFRVRVSYNCDNIKSVAVDVFFDEDGDELVALRSWSIGNAKDDFAKVLVACNELNTKYRWVKFYIDGDYDIAVAIDAVVSIDTVGAECLQLVQRMVNIIDEAYPTIMRARFGG